jgi:hypothetical protein
LRVSEAIVDLLVPVILARCPILWISGFGYRNNHNARTRSQFRTVPAAAHFAAAGLSD